MDGPGFVKRVERPEPEADLEPGQVRLRFKVGGLCGSDMPKLNGIFVRKGAADNDGAPMHELVAEVIESASSELSVGQRVVGSGGRAGLAEFHIESDQTMIAVPDELGDVEAVTIQSLGTVLRAANRLPDVTGLRVAVIGAGPIGLAFCHVLKHRGAAHLTAIDPVDRGAAAREYGADEFVRMRSTQWVETVRADTRPQLIVEAVGHQHATIPDAIRAVADLGFIYGFGSPDDPDYSIPYQQIYERGLTLMAGRTLGGWLDVLRQGRDYLLKHRSDFASYISHTIPAENAQAAYTLYARPQNGRLKVAIVE